MTVILTEAVTTGLSLIMALLIGVCIAGDARSSP